MLIYQNAEGVHGQSKFGSPWSRAMFLKHFHPGNAEVLHLFLRIPDPLIRWNKWPKCRSEKITGVDNLPRVNSLIKLRLCGLLFTQYETVWPVRIRLCRFVGIHLSR